MKFFSGKKNPLHEEYKQLKRQRQALHVECDSLNRAGRTGTIGKYKVSLERCSCEEFSHRQKPCKHMYRLAFELGVFPLDADQIEEAIKVAPRPNPCNCELSFRKPVPKNFVVVDFEAASRSNNSVCQIGLVVVENNSVTAQKSYLIRPPKREFTATRIHGIKFKDVKDKPRFNRLWRQIKKYFEGQTVAAYSLPSDLNYLFATLEHYKIPRPNFMAFDVLENVRACKDKLPDLADLENIQLATVAKKFGLVHNAHDAASDALVTAQIQIYLSKKLSAEETTVHLSTVDAVVDSLVKAELPMEVALSYCADRIKLKPERHPNFPKREFPRRPCRAPKPSGF